MANTAPNRKLIYPAGLISVCLLAQLLLLAWSAFPTWTMRGHQRESWSYLIGLDVLLASWLWPMLRARGAGLGQAVMEAALLAAACVPAAVPAINWVDASSGQILAPACYAAAWLLVGMLAVISRPAVRWVWRLLATLANFGLLGLGYVRLDFLGGDVWPIWRLCPMACASYWAESGWPTVLADQLAGLVPVVVLVVLLAVRIMAPSRDKSPKLAPV